MTQLSRRATAAPRMYAAMATISLPQGLLSGCALGDAHATPARTGANDPILLWESLPRERSEVTYAPASSWREARSGSGDTRTWSQATTGCRLDLLSMADPKPSSDGLRSVEILSTMSKFDTASSTGPSTVIVPRDTGRPVQFAARQTLGGGEIHGYAARAFTSSGGLLFFQLTCPGHTGPPGDVLARTLAEGRLVHVG